MLLGIDYVSLWLGDFVVGVPPSEWAYWHSFNVPFVGFDKQNELFAHKNLFRLTTNLSRQVTSVNARWSGLSGTHSLPFRQSHNTEKDYRTLTRALPRKADAHELIDRAKAFHGLVVERIAESPIKAFLKNAGYASKTLEGLGSIKLFSTFMMVVRLADVAIVWQDDITASLKYAQGKVEAWQSGNVRALDEEESKTIHQVTETLEILFLVHDLRLMSAHATSSQLEKEIGEAFKKRSQNPPPLDNYRSAVSNLYDSLAKCLENCRQ